MSTANKFLAKHPYAVLRPPRCGRGWRKQKTAISSVSSRSSWPRRFHFQIYAKQCGASSVNTKETFSREFDTNTMAKLATNVILPIVDTADDLLPWPIDDVAFEEAHAGAGGAWHGELAKVVGLALGWHGLRQGRHAVYGQRLRAKPTWQEVLPRQWIAIVQNL